MFMRSVAALSLDGYTIYHPNLIQTSKMPSRLGLPHLGTEEPPQAAIPKGDVEVRRDQIDAIQAAHRSAAATEKSMQNGSALIKS